MNQRIARVLYGGVVVASTMTAALAFETTSENSPGLWTRDVVHVESAEELVAVSPIVVEGTIAASSEGRIAGDGDAALKFREIVVDVSHSWQNSNEARTPDQITFEIVGWDADGTEYEHINGQAIPSLGESWVLFLIEKSDTPGIYRPVNSVSMERVMDDKLQGHKTEDGATEDQAPLDRFAGRPMEDLRRFLDSEKKQKDGK